MASIVTLRHNSTTNQIMYDRQTKMADNKRRFFERDSREKEAANSASNSETSRHSKEQNYDDPPNSRLFILCGRNVTEDNLREAFEKFGTIKELWIVKDKNSGESKGTYIHTHHTQIITHHT